MSKAITILNRPDAKRKLLVAFIFVFCWALTIAEVAQDTKSITAWGSFLALSLLAISAWPLVKDFIWPAGLEHVASTQLSLACHGWKNSYINIDPGLMNRISEVKGENIWDKILSASNHKCTEENLARFRPLFVGEAISTQRQIDEVIIRYGDVLPSELRVLAQHAMSRLSLAPFSYTIFGTNPSDQGFYNQFLGVINALSNLERPTQELQNKTKIN